MPIKQAAKKAFRQDQVKAARNMVMRKKIDSLVKNIRKAVAGKQIAEVEKTFVELQKAIDKAAKRHVLHPNKAARLKSRVKATINKASK